MNEQASGSESHDLPGAPQLGRRVPGQNDVPWTHWKLGPCCPRWYLVRADMNLGVFPRGGLCGLWLFFPAQGCGTW